MTIETIFDHDPTEEELDLVFNIRSKEDLHRYKITLARSQDTQYGEIARLYLHRNKRERARHYIDRIRNPVYRFTIEQAYLYPDLADEL
ncbi:MAG: hypothetical protein H5U10_14310 [Desulfacinum sp.]|jgi:hypothetical protein|nr:hypothetical protein [Desulfacinum sp.]MBZ4659977.1 hypothetical protein [Desulfacinum sp.]